MSRRIGRFNRLVGTALSVACAAALTAAPAIAFAGEDEVEVDGAAAAAPARPPKADGDSHAGRSPAVRGEDGRPRDAKAPGGKGHEGEAAKGKKGKKARTAKAAESRASKDPARPKKAKKSARAKKKAPAKKPSATSARGDGKAPAPASGAPAPAPALDPGLEARTVAIARAFPGHRLSVVRDDRPIGEGSLHATGRAIDLRVEGIPDDAVFAFCRTLPDTGCGHYPRSGFVHVDVQLPGAGSRRWTDLSLPGEPPRYLSDPGAKDEQASISPRPASDTAPRR